MGSKIFRVQLEVEFELPLILADSTTHKVMSERLSEDVEKSLEFPLFEMAKFYGGSSRNLKVGAKCVRIQNPNWWKRPSEDTDIVFATEGET